MESERREEPVVWRGRVFSPPLRWFAMLVLSVAFYLVLNAIGLPAGVMLGPMLAAIVVAANLGPLFFPSLPFHLAQGMIGYMIGCSIPKSIVADLQRDWPLFALGVASTMAASSFLGWLLTRWRVLPGSTAIWGISPGAGLVMTLMSEGYGADMRLVAFMQYLRSVCIAIVASLVSLIWIEATDAARPPIVWFPPMAWLPFLEVMALIVAGIVGARFFRIPGGSTMPPLVLGAVFRNLGWLTYDLPPWLLAIGFAVIGWNIGLRFTRPILAHAARAFFRVLATILALIAMCGVFAVGLVVGAGIDPLTACLATIPGGVETVAIIAASSHADVPFVMAMQTARFMLVLLTAPAIARFIARKTGAASCE